MNGQPHLYCAQVPATALAEMLAPFQAQLHHLYRESEAKIELVTYSQPEPAWYHGRAFGPALEIRWEQTRNGYELLLLTETELELAQEWEAAAGAEEFDVEAGQVLLWGTHPKYLSRGHYLAAETGEAWIETRIPQALHYPVDGSPRYVRANVIIYRRRGKPVLTRLVSLEGDNDEPGTL